jgi:hypothetical protein
MRRGDISDAQPPRVLMQWEHFLAVPRDDEGAVSRLLEGLVARLRRPTLDVNAYFPHHHALKVAWDCSTRKGLRVDAWTQWPHQMVPAIREWCIDWSVPVHRVVACSHEQMEREIMRQPHIFAIYHCGDGRPLAFGGKGVYVPAPEDAAVLG